MVLSISDRYRAGLATAGYTGSLADMQMQLMEDETPTVADHNQTASTITDFSTAADARAAAFKLAEDTATNHTAAFTLALTDTEVHTVAPASSFSVTLPATTTPGHKFKFIKTDTDTTKTVTLTGTFGPGAVANFILRGLGQWVEFETTTVSGTFQVVGAGPCVVPTGTASTGLTDGILFVEYTP